MKVIAITGSIATGKSGVSNYLIKRGFPVIDTDILSRVVVEKGSTGLKQLTEAFGQQILNEDGTLNRKKLGSIIFSDEESKQTINRILHPLIADEARQQVKDYQSAGERLIFVDIPLYFEVNINIPTDDVWLVYTTPTIQLERLMKRNQINEQAAQQLINNQISIEDKAKWAEKIIDNSGTLETTYQQVEALLKLELEA